MFYQSFHTGFYAVQGFIRDSQRCNSLKGYIVPAENRTNLDILTNAFVTKVRKYYVNLLWFYSPKLAYNKHLTDNKPQNITRISQISSLRVWLYLH